MVAVSREIKTAVILLMLALLPLRALATVTVGFCAMHDHASAGMSADHDHDHDGAPHGDSNHEQCNACVEHCGSASLVAPAHLTPPVAGGAIRITTGERFAAG